MIINDLHNENEGYSNNLSVYLLKKQNLDEKILKDEIIKDSCELPIEHSTSLKKNGYIYNSIEERKSEVMLFKTINLINNLA